ncbi:MAG TPA: PA14 domain-containing protein, partial [Lacipirellulaceae bacterium]|nr:PA14 domain-containing protein [Lacipirellulaceae bacterium]
PKVQFPAPFPGQQINVNVDDFVVVVDAVVTIPAAGNWTFGVRSDDGFRLTVGDQVSGFPGPRGPADTLQTFTFDTAGDYNLNLLFFERGGGAMLELFAAPGTYSSWNSTNFRLVGNTAGGGLAVKSNVTDASGG